MEGFFLQKGIRWSLRKVGSKAQLREKGFWEWAWGQERGKTFGSAGLGILRRNDAYTLSDHSHPTLAPSSRLSCEGLK